jgi:hypothetical protein
MYACVLHVRLILSSLISFTRQFVGNSTNYQARHYDCCYLVNYCVRWLCISLLRIKSPGLCVRYWVMRVIVRMLWLPNSWLLCGHVYGKQCNHSHVPDIALVSPTNARNSQCVCLSVCLSSERQTAVRTPGLGMANFCTKRLTRI